MSALARELRDEPPAGLVAALSDAELDRLATTLRRTREAQSDALDQALRDALRHVPFFARGAVKKIVFG